MEYFLLPNWKKTTICRHQQTNCTLPLHLFSTNQPKRSTRATGARLTKCTQPFCGGWPKKVNKIKGARVGKYDCNRWTVFDKTRLIYFSIINFKSNLNSLSKLFIHFGFNLKSQRGNRCKFIRNFFFQFSLVETKLVIWMALQYINWLGWLHLKSCITILVFR